MKVYHINDKTSYVNDSVHWFGPFRNAYHLGAFLSDTQEEQWFAAVQNKVVLDILNAFKKVTDDSRKVYKEEV